MHRTSEEALRAPDSIFQMVHRRQIATSERRGADAGVFVLVLLIVAMTILIWMSVSTRPGDYLTIVIIVSLSCLAAIPIIFISYHKYRYANDVVAGKTKF